MYMFLGLIDESALINGFKLRVKYTKASKIDLYKKYLNIWKSLFGFFILCIRILFNAQSNIIDEKKLKIAIEVIK